MGSSLLVDGLNLLPSLDFLPILLAETSFLTGFLNKFWLFFQVALGLGFVIFVHELGHFLAAKTFGVRCDKFYVGFDVPISIGPIKFPRTLGKFQWGETEYGIGIIPLGGYVKMLGQDDDPRKQAEENAKIRGDGDADDEEIPLDPRSYPAKAVWQRMIIISAGVVMNLIFAVILAGVAYRFGVPYTPTVVGSTFGGGPAWSVGFEPGDQVVRFGDMTEDNEQLRYDDFAIGVIMRGFEAKDQDLPVTLIRDGQRKEIVANATPEYSPDRDIYRIGLNPPNTPKLGSTPFKDFSFLAKIKPDLQQGDQVVAVDGEPLPIDERFNTILGSELTSRLQANWEEPVELTIERNRDNDDPVETVAVTVPPVPVTTIGLGFAAGPVVALQQGSIGETAGVRVGDIITAINGEAIVNALQLPSMAARLVGKEITLTVRRGDTGGGDANTVGQSVDIEMSGPAIATFDPIADFSGALTLGGLGIAFDVTNEVTSVADRLAGGDIQVGDKLTQIHWAANDETQEALKELFTSKAFDPKPIDRQFNVARFYDLLQSIPEGTSINCFLLRDERTINTELRTEYADGWYWHQRGILLSKLTNLHTTDNFATAAQLGLLETSSKFMDVLNFLRLLVTGKIGAKGVGGPVAIVNAASNEASEGVSRLLLFLTLLSANLAILNFLPIPALDGGHMVFLTAELIRGKPVSEALQIRLTMVGVLGLLSLMAFVIVKDIMRLMG